MSAISVRRFRTIFFSDIHLGTKGCQAHLLLDFMRYHDADTIYLVGDIVDLWRMRKGLYWPQSHNDVVQKLLRKARKGARIVFIPGNHDELLRPYAGYRFGGVEVARKAIHTTADGRRILVTHGDEFDVVVRYAKWLAFLGDSAYVLALWGNTHFNALRRLLGFPYWSLSAWLKAKVKNAVNYIGEFEAALAETARRQGAQAVICGHIHHPAMRDIDGVQYINIGDFVESCTALTEGEDGRLDIITWTEERQRPGAPAMVRDQAAA